MGKTEGQKVVFSKKEKLKRSLPKYNEIDFFDKFEARDNDLHQKPSPVKVGATDNRDFLSKAAVIMEFGDIANNLSLKTINFSFSPKCMRHSSGCLKRRLDENDCVYS